MRQETAIIHINRDGSGSARFGQYTTSLRYRGALRDLERWAYDQGAIFASVRPHSQPTYTKRLEK